MARCIKLYYVEAHLENDLVESEKRISSKYHVEAQASRLLNFFHAQLN